MKAPYRSIHDAALGLASFALAQSESASAQTYLERVLTANH